MEHLTIEQQIRSEIYRAFELLGADRDLLAVVGSWGDTLDDQEILAFLKEWNAEEARSKERA
jgi:hypothetical protein